MKRVALLLLAGGSCLPAWADDLAPPPWRGQPGTTFQKWTFSNDTLPQKPDPLWINQAGEPLHQFSEGIQWEFNHVGRPGVYRVNPERWLVFNIPNFNQPSEKKDVRVQVTWRGGEARTTVETATANFVGPKVDRVLADGWIHSTWDIPLNVCPVQEWVFVRNAGSVPMFVDQVVVDTRCVPEPASVVGLSLGGAYLLRRKQSRKR